MPEIGCGEGTADLVRVEPISGPGACGAQYPLKVAALGEGIGSFGFADDLRPPGVSATSRAGRCSRRRRRRRQPIRTTSIQAARCASPVMARRPPGRSRCRRPACSRMTRSTCRPRARPTTGRPRTARLMRARRPILRATAIPRHTPHGRPPPPQQSELPRLGPSRGNPVTSVGPVAIKPTATLACPIVSMLDRWFADSVQPAAQRWFGAARRRDQADLRLFLPRHERQSARPYFRARLRQRARHIGLRARRWPPHHREERLERHAGRAGFSARHPGRRPASFSIPCWRRAPTPIMPIIFMST